MQRVADLPDHPWFGKDDRWWTGALTVHHFRLLQLLFGAPKTVYAVTGRDESQPGVTMGGYGHLLLRYPGGMAVAVTSTGTYYGTVRAFGCEYSPDGQGQQIYDCGQLGLATPALTGTVAQDGAAFRIFAIYDGINGPLDRAEHRLIHPAISASTASVILETVSRSDRWVGACIRHELCVLS